VLGDELDALGLAQKMPERVGGRITALRGPKEPDLDGHIELFGSRADEATTSPFVGRDRLR
jgi:hypothetical protein